MHSNTLRINKTILKTIALIKIILHEKKCFSEIPKAFKAVHEKDTTLLLTELQNRILELYEVESKAFEKLKA